MWTQVFGTVVGAFLGWAAVLVVLFYFLDFPPILEVLQVLLQTVTLGSLP